MTSDIVIKIQDVTFKYHDEVVLDNINLEIKKGEFLGLIGPNGSGKTTLLKIILGLLKPDTGTVNLFGENTASFKNWNKIGYVPQKAGSTVTNFPITVEEVVAMGTIGKNDQQAITNSIAEVGMEKYRKRLLNELSGGQLQRVFIARALVSRPELLILDEPTVGVDVDSQAKFYELLKTLNLKSGLTLVLVSHDIEVVAHEVTEVACINSRLICHGKPKDILSGDFMEKLYGKNLRLVIHGH